MKNSNGVQRRPSSDRLGGNWALDETAYRESEPVPFSARCNEAAQVRQSDIQMVDSLVQLNRDRPNC